jgi:hypothetical protein
MIRVVAERHTDELAGPDADGLEMAGGLGHENGKVCVGDGACAIDDGRVRGPAAGVVKDRVGDVLPALRIGNGEVSEDHGSRIGRNRLCVVMVLLPTAAVAVCSVQGNSAPECSGTRRGSFRINKARQREINRRRGCDTCCAAIAICADLTRECQRGSLTSPFSCARACRRFSELRAATPREWSRRGSGATSG